MLYTSVDVYKRQQQQDKGAEYAKEEAETQKGLEDLLALNDSELPKEENPIDHVGRLKAQPLLELILPKDRALSEKHANEKEMLSARAKMCIRDRNHLGLPQKETVAFPGSIAFVDIAVDQVRV